MGLGPIDIEGVFYARTRPCANRRSRNHGAREIFGIPGDFVLPLFKVIEESGTLPF